MVHGAIVVGFSTTIIYLQCSVISMVSTQYSAAIIRYAMIFCLLICLLKLISLCRICQVCMQCGTYCFVVIIESGGKQTRFTGTSGKDSKFCEICTNMALAKHHPFILIPGNLILLTPKPVTSYLCGVWGQKHSFGNICIFAMVAAESNLSLHCDYSLPLYLFNNLQSAADAWRKLCEANCFRLCFYDIMCTASTHMVHCIL